MRHNRIDSGDAEVHGFQKASRKNEAHGEAGWVAEFGPEISEVHTSTGGGARKEPRGCVRSAFRAAVNAGIHPLRFLQPDLRMRKYGIETMSAEGATYTSEGQSPSNKYPPKFEA